MPYNPQVQDISGQLLAQGMMQRAQSISGLVGDFMKMEDERQKTTGALKGFLSDPYYQQQVNSNPELAGFAQKVQKGSASLGDVRQFLGTMTAMQSAREQQQKADQMEAQREYNQALREQALAQAVATESAVNERERMRTEALQRAKLLKEVFGAEQLQAVSPEDAAFYENIGGEAAAPKKRPLGASEAFRQFVSEGGVPDEVTIRMFGGLMGEEVAGAKLEGQRAVAAERAAGAAATQAAKTEGALKAIEAKAEYQLDQGIRSINAMEQSGDYTKEEAREARRKRIEALNKTDQMTALLGQLLMGGGGGSMSGTTMSGGGGAARSGGTAKAPASSQYRVISSRSGPGD